jgi:hypothetical protein
MTSQNDVTLAKKYQKIDDINRGESLACCFHSPTTFFYHTEFSSSKTWKGAGQSNKSDTLERVPNNVTKFHMGSEGISQSVTRHFV